MTDQAAVHPSIAITVLAQAVARLEMANGDVAICRLPRFCFGKVKMETGLLTMDTLEHIQRRSSVCHSFQSEKYGSIVVPTGGDARRTAR